MPNKDLKTYPKGYPRPQAHIDRGILLKRIAELEDELREYGAVIEHLRNRLKCEES